ncbi:hypothetical protein KEM54_006525 [Ascosphaera aggregata]|nr:hypothetical protein KEM54_006525 [Ascosphaera aggregata]
MAAERKTIHHVQDDYDEKNWRLDTGTGIVTRITTGSDTDARQQQQQPPQEEQQQQQRQLLLLQKQEQPQHLQQQERASRKIAGSGPSKEDRRKSLQQLLPQQQAETDAESAIAADSDSESDSDSDLEEEGIPSSKLKKSSILLIPSSSSSLLASSSISPTAISRTSALNRHRRPSSSAGPHRPPKARAPTIPPNLSRHRRVRSESANDEYVRFRSEVLGAEIPPAIAANSEAPTLLAKELDKAFSGSGWTSNTSAGGIGHQSASAAAASRRKNFPGLNTGFTSLHSDTGSPTTSASENSRYEKGNFQSIGGSIAGAGLNAPATARPRSLLSLRSNSADDVLTSSDTTYSKFGDLDESGYSDLTSGSARLLARDQNRHQSGQKLGQFPSPTRTQSHNRTTAQLQTVRRVDASSPTNLESATPGTTNTNSNDNTSRGILSDSHGRDPSADLLASPSKPLSGRSTPNISFVDRSERGFANMNIRHQNGNFMVNGASHGGTVGGATSSSNGNIGGGMAVGEVSPRLAPINGGPVGGGASNASSSMIGYASGAAGSGGPGIMNMPMNAGHPMDLNHLYEMVMELGNVLRSNREMTKGIVSGAEEVMKRAAMEGAPANLQQVNSDISAARIADLKRDLARERALNSVLLAEQYENLDLISTYEASITEIVAQIRHYCQNQNLNFLSQKRHYNDLLQEERDAHLQSRLERDHWHNMAIRCGEMVREAYRLRCEEEEGSLRVVEGLQNEIRALRGALGMERQREEDETGWEVLKDYKSASQGPD